jgi:hypothetical protein
MVEKQTECRSFFLADLARQTIQGKKAAQLQKSDAHVWAVNFSVFHLGR